MKKIFLLLSVLVMAAISLTALADGRTPPEDKKTYTTTDVIAAETLYRIYDKKFYDAASEQPGTVVRLDYVTSQYGDPVTHWANVYLPYGYDENDAERYHIIYFFHGTNETQDAFIADDRAKNAVDNMIEVGLADPFIMVFPTYYYDYENRTLNVDRFVHEVREDLMPAVESTYRTYAETADDAGFKASRKERAFAGYSRGGRMTWQMFGRMLDYAYWYLPMSGAFTNPEENPVDADLMAPVYAALEAQPDYKGDFYLYVSCGGARDVAFDGCTDMVKAMMADPEVFSYGLDPSLNNVYYLLSNEVHQTLIGRHYLYNAFCDVLWK